MSDHHDDINDILVCQQCGAYFGPILLFATCTILTCMCFLQDYLYSRFGLEICRGYLGSRRAEEDRQEQQMLENEELAIHERQNPHQQAAMQVVQDKNQILMIKEEERMKKYRAFLKPYTLVVTRHEFIEREEKEKIGVENWKDIELRSTRTMMVTNGHLGSSASVDDAKIGDEAILMTQEENIVNHTDSGDTMNVGNSSSSSINDSNTCVEFTKTSRFQAEGGYIDIKSHVLTEMNAAQFDVSMVENDEAIPSNRDDQDHLADLELGDPCAAGSLHFTMVTAERMLQLPIKDEEGHFRKVCIECVICLVEYEVGDEVVWSTRRSCPHAFHAECILLWLGKGKKRCPICRHFFVPGQRVDDKDVIEHDQRDLMNGER